MKNRKQTTMKATRAPAFAALRRGRQNLLAAVLVGALASISACSHAAEANGRKTFTILHANDLHSKFLGLGPATDYTPFKLNIKLNIDDTIAGHRSISDEIDKLTKSVTAAVFASRGYSIDQPLAVAPRDLPNTFTDIAAGTLLANLCTDAFRSATKADIGFTANGMLRAGLTRGKSGVQTVYDVFAVAPLGAGVVDPTAGSTLVTGYFTGLELKNRLEFFLVDNPAHPGEYFPRVSGARFRYDPSRPKFDVVTAIELGDVDRGYKAIDITGKDERLYSLTCPLMLGTILVGIPKYTKGKLPLSPKNKAGQPLTSRVEALDAPRRSTAHLMSPPGTVDESSIATGAGKGAVQEIKEWQAIMDHLRRLPVKSARELPTIPVDERAAEVRAIRKG
jgi:5'-nucleotidase